MASDHSDVNPYASPTNLSSHEPKATVRDSSSSIRLVGDVSVDDYLAAYRLAMWKSGMLWFRYTFRVLLGMGTLIFLYAAYQAYRFENWLDMKYTLAIAAWLIASLLWIFFRTRQNVKRYLDAMDTKIGDAPVLVDEAGVHVRGEAMSSDFSWDAFDGYRTNGPIVVLYLTYPRLYVALFGKHASSPTEWRHLKLLVASKLVEM